MSSVTNILLTSNYLPLDSRIKVADVQLGSRDNDQQHFRLVNGNDVGGYKAWEANTFMAGVNYMRPIEDVLADLEEAISYATDVVVVVHRPDAEVSEIWVHSGKQGDKFKMQKYPHG